MKEKKKSKKLFCCCICERSLFDTGPFYLEIKLQETNQEKYICLRCFNELKRQIFLEEKKEAKH